MAGTKGRECQVAGCRVAAVADVFLDRPGIVVDLRDQHVEDEYVAALRVCAGHGVALGTVEDLSDVGDAPCLVVWVDAAKVGGWRLVSELTGSGAYERIVLYPPGSMVS